MLDDLAAEEALGLELTEQNEYVEQQRADRIVVLAAGDGHGRLPGELRPVAAGQVGQGEERFPDIGRPVVQRRRQRRFSGGDLRRMVLHKPYAAAAEALGLEMPEALAFL